MFKVCKKCNIEKPIEEFKKAKSCKDGHRGSCKECEHFKYKNKKDIAMKNYYQNNKDEILKYQENYRNENRDILNKKSKQYYEDNKEQIKQKRKTHNVDKENKLKKSREYEKKRIENDFEYKLKITLRNRINKAIAKGYKKSKSFDLIGCSIKFVKKHLESMFNENMSWENYGQCWEIDHIIPCSLFELKNYDEQQICFHYTNLRPLDISLNRSKGNKMEV